MTPYDVVTLGETMLRLTPPNLRRLEQATTLDIEVGGTESNVAIGLARLGLKVAWLSRLTDNPLGRLIASRIAAHGVDTRHVSWTTSDRVGVLFYEMGKAPRGSRVLYDRRHSAISHMQAADLPQDLFRPAGARLLHTTGITLALGQALTDTVHHALKLAQAAGWLVSFDINYRHTLWEPLQARKGCQTYAAAADILFMPRGDACLLFDLATDMPAEAILARVAAAYPQATIVLTLGADGALGQAPGEGVIQQAAYPAEAVDRLGGGDAFAAGFLYGYLSSTEATHRLPTALRWGAAAAALKYTIPGDAPLIDRQEVEALLQQEGHTPGLQR
jgi:2-dehydro-3-deoxygluconokinase